MARIARIVVPDCRIMSPRGAQVRAGVFRGSRLCAVSGYAGRACRGARCAIWAWCLMPNHVPIILVPSDADGLRRTFADLHRRYITVTVYSIP